MKCLFLLAALTVSLNVINAQNFNSTEVLPDVALDNVSFCKAGKYYFATNFKTKFTGVNSYVLKKSPVALNLIKLGEDFKAAKQVDFPEEVVEFSPFTTKIYNVNDKLILFYWKLADTKDLINLWSCEIDMETLAPKNKRQLWSRQWKYELYDAGQSPLEFVSSVDNKKHAVIAYDEVSEKFDWVWIGDNLETNVIGTYKPESFKKLDVFSTALSNEGVLALTYTNIEKKQIQASILLVDGKKAQLVPVSDGDNSITGLYVVAQKAAFAIVAQKCKENYNWDALGYYTLKGTKLTTGKTIEVPTELVDRLRREALTSKKTKSINKIKLIPTYIDDENFALSGYFKDIINTEKSTFYVTSAIMNIFFQKEFPSFSLVPRLRVMTGTLVGSGINILQHEKKVIVLYNDAQANVLRDPSMESKRNDIFTDHVVIAAVFEFGKEPVKKLAYDMQNEKLFGWIGYNGGERLVKNKVALPFAKYNGLGLKVLERKHFLLNID